MNQINLMNIFIQIIQIENKYAIHAYTHGPVTGFGPTVATLLLLTIGS